MNERTTMQGKPVFTVPAKTVVNFDSRFDKKLLCDGITFTAGNACNFSCVVPSSKLRFLQYVTNETKPWWSARQPRGAVLL
ncbi:MAG: hypothetical protein KGL39_02790 [Patescibacteria group bacterium]|nr:hypothetical protein [Patescibacteria group bacterium]